MCMLWVVCSCRINVLSASGLWSCGCYANANVMAWRFWICGFYFHMGFLAVALAWFIPSPSGLPSHSVGSSHCRYGWWCYVVRILGILLFVILTQKQHTPEVHSDEDGTVSTIPSTQVCHFFLLFVYVCVCTMHVCSIYLCACTWRVPERACRLFRGSVGTAL